jgi:hypothetical protein
MLQLVQEIYPLTSNLDRFVEILRVHIVFMFTVISIALLLFLDPLLI